MRYSIREGVFWLLIFLLLHFALLLLFIIDPPESSRGFLAEFGVGLGFLGMAFFISQFITTGRFRDVAPAYGADIVLQVHKYAGIAGVLLVLMHPLLLIASDPDYLRFYDPTDNFMRAMGMIAVTVALVGIIATSINGVPGWVNYEQWRLGHAALAVAIVFIGTVHGLQVSNYLDTWWKQFIWVLSALIGIALLAEVRLLRPLRMRKHPYKLRAVKPECGNAWTIELEPDGHDGMDFRAGQFAWITIGNTPFKLQQNPFSIATPGGSKTIAFTAQVAGDFTSTWKDLVPGTRAWLDGPYGSFTILDGSKGFYFIAGGSGIVPVMSILRTMHRDGDKRPVKLLYGNPSLDEIIYYEELEELAGSLNLTLVHFLENMPKPTEVSDTKSQFEEGYIERKHIEEFLPNDENRYSYYTCGPAPLMDTAEQSLREMGVDWRRIIPERYDII